MYPSEVRQRILADQDEINAQLDRMEALLYSDDTEAVEMLREACMALVPKLMDHIYLDDLLLLPVLREVDAWADVRTTRLEQHHTAQRGDIHLIIETLGRSDTPVAAIRAVAQKVIADVRAHFREEGSLMLNTEVLRDDLVSIAVSG